MSKFTDATRATLTGYFNAGDQPTEAQFTALILAIQEGIEEHEHDATGDGDGVGVLSNVTAFGVGCVATTLLQLHNAGVGVGDHTTLHLTTGDTGALVTDGMDIQYNAAEYGIINVLEDKNLYLATNNAIRVTILNSGETGIATAPTVGWGLSVFESHAGGYAAYFFNDGDATDRYGIGIQCGQDAAAGTLSPVLFYDGDADYAGHITVVNGVPAFVNRSDESLKENIVPTAKNGLEVITGLKVKDFTWKKQPGMKPTTGFIAQEVEVIMPEATSKMAGLKGVAMGMFMPMVVLSIQELEARLTQGGL